MQCPSVVQPPILAIPALEGASPPGHLGPRDREGPPERAGIRQASALLQPSRFCLSALLRGIETVPTLGASLPLCCPSQLTEDPWRSERQENAEQVCGAHPRLQPQRRDAFGDPRASGRSRRAGLEQQAAAREDGPLNRVWHHVLALRAHLQAVRGRDSGGT